jgi:hypothetical protein
MAVYFFHLRDGDDLLLDEEGRELSDAGAIAKAATLAARSIISADALDGVIGFDQRIDVEDSAGNVVHSLEFSDAVEIIPAKLRQNTATG